MPKYGNKVKLCYTDTDSLILHIKTENFYEDINNDVEECFDTSNDEIDKPLLITNKNKKVLGKFKDVLRERTITKFVGLRSKTYAYLTDDLEEVKKNKGVKMCVVETELKFNHYDNAILKSQDLKVNFIMYILKKLIKSL